jgi:hypothetical protein
MKKLFTLSMVILITFKVFAQSPQKMSYQAVIRDASNVLVTNHSVGMRISILQGSVSGTVVYSETQTPTTNANGLVSIEIGGGTGFDVINWANGLYFLKTETDPAGGTNYNISGTSQMLSVPYALYSKTSETSSDAVKITGDQTIAGIKTFTGTINAGDNRITHVATPINDKNAANKFYVDSVFSSGTHSIGASYGGGIVFYVYDNGRHGLIAATADQSTEILWYNGTYRVTGATGNGVGSGAMNTAIIVATQISDNPTGNFAAKVCADYSVTNGGVTYGDWYLPSIYELNLLYLQKGVVGGFANNFYWSSNEFLDVSAYNLYFITGTQNYPMKNQTYCVRAIRAF